MSTELDGQAGARKGVAAAAEQKRADARYEWQDHCVNEALTMLKSGIHERHELASILSRRYGKSVHACRRVLKKHLPK